MMKAGKYYVGDLCYVMSDAEWEQFCKITIQGNKVIDGEFEMPDGRKFATYSTAYGDGVYYDQYGHLNGADVLWEKEKVNYLPASTTSGKNALYKAADDIIGR